MAEKVSWPAWRYGPNGESRIFQKDDIVPKGWTDSPKTATKKSTKPVKDVSVQEQEPSSAEKQETIASIREAGVEISDDATVEEINAAIDKLTAK